MAGGGWGWEVGEGGGSGARKLGNGRGERRDVRFASHLKKKNNNK